MEPNVLIKLNALDNTKEAFASLKKNLGAVESSFVTAQRNIEALEPAFRKMALVGTAALAGIGAIAGKTIKNASDLGESINAVNVVFGKGADNILKFGETAAKSVGMSTAAFNQMATITGALLKDTGKPLSEVADMTTELTKRAADMASVFNTDVSDAMSAINQAIRGETEAIRRYAGDVTDASLQTYLYSQGIQKNVTDLTEQEKRLYRVQLIMAQTAVTAGDFANTSDSLANRQRILAADLENLSAKIGAQLIPVLESLLNKVGPVIAKVGEWVEKNPELTRNIILASGAVAGLTAVVGTLGLAFSVLLSPIALVVAGLAILATSVYAVVFRWNELPIALKLVLYPMKMVLDSLKLLYEGFMWVGSALSKFLGIASASSNTASSSVGNLQGMVDSLIDPMAGQSRVVESFAGTIAAVGTKASETADKIKKLKEEAAGIFSDAKKDEASANQELANAIVDQEQKVAEIKDQIRDAEHDRKEAETKDQRHDADAKMGELRRQLSEEQNALASANGMKMMLQAELSEAERRARLSDFERKVEDIQAARVLRLEAQLARLQEIQEEVAAERAKSSAIAGAFGAAQSTMQSAIAKTREVAETEAERMKKAFDRAISSMNQLSSDKAAAGTLYSSITKTITGKAVGGPVSHNTPYMVGEVGPELFVPSTAGRIIPNNQLAGAGAGSTPNIYLTITGNSFMGERDMAEKIGDQIISIIKQNGRL
jgi:hypothetical protein